MRFRLYYLAVIDVAAGWPAGTRWWVTHVHPWKNKWSICEGGEEEVPAEFNKAEADLWLWRSFQIHNGKTWLPVIEPIN